VPLLGSESNVSGHYFIPKSKTSSGVRRRAIRTKTPSSFRNLSFGTGDVIVKRLTLPGGLLTSGAGGIIAVDSISSTTVQSGPATEWASFAARYQQYRVRAMRVVNKAVLPVNTATITQGSLFVSDYIGSSSPASSAQVLSDERAVVHSTAKDWVYQASWSRNPNAMLWNPTSAAVPVANQFGVAIASSSAPALTVNTTYGSYTLEYVVEFRGSQ
jgi:hypothetical protein